MTAVTLFPIPAIPLVQPGDDLATLFVERLAAVGETFQPGDVLVVAQKIISKAEGRMVDLDIVQPGPEAERLAAIVDRDPRVVQVVLEESNAVLRARRGLLVVEQRNGWVCANAGVDRSNVQQSNVAQEGAGDTLALLPWDADASAAALRSAIAARHGRRAGGDHQR